MTEWNTATPTGSEAISSGDDRIREMKTALQEALRAQESEGTEAVFPGSDSANPVFRPRLPRGSSAARPAADANQGLYVNTTRNIVERCDGSAWADIATLIPSGTVMLFFQEAAPTGWTKLTTQNDKALRIVSGTGGGTGGTHGLSSPPSASHTHALDTDNIDHAHKAPMAVISGTTYYGVANPFGTSGSADGEAWLGFSGTNIISNGVYMLTGNMESNTTHNHGGLTGPGNLTAFAPQYIDVVSASKD